uniref:Secreted Odorant Binding Protein Family protein n=1 Tax=Pristhesancus plagipennis TaxID=1955184 RepID=A0A2K8JPG4_PRIPG|nr:secreted Odorant Binding Protein Family protein [Pristhesancus plagipennis]
MFLTALVYFISFTCFVNSAIDFDGLTKDKLSELEEKAMKVCVEKHNINETLLEDVLQEKAPIPTSREFKCMLGCYNEELGYGKGTVPQWDVMKKVHELEYEKQEDKEKSFKLVEICKNKVPEEAEDYCELGYAMFTCYAEESKQLGLELL